ncbi:tripartite motif-containing 13 isoform X1 [Acipenser ruthenus]|uniref:tripartite motif-containing 13 isoform X1 n=1 Tax=Acipenser ruthenus TaxID=7906 RepID=UPI00145C109C|nr:tripartite motif-containing 13 isoform X1 [Acipenser ruthenus]
MFIRPEREKSAQQQAPSLRSIVRYKQLNMELLEEDLTCPVCCCLFEDPRVLPCSHSFCKKCLEGILEGNSNRSWRPPFKCPTCRKETTTTGINSLQINYSLRGIVEKYNKIKLTPKMSICRTHSGQPLNIFCSSDLKLICGFCATMGDHKGHTFCAMEHAYQQEKAAFEELFLGFEKWRNADVVSCLNTLEDSKRKALQLVSKDGENVTEYFDKLIHTLEQKKNEILSDFETLKLVVLQTYDPEIKKLSMVLEEQKRALRIAESFKDVSDPLMFLQQMQEFREKLRIIREISLPSRPCMDVSPIIQNFDTKKWDSVKLKDVDKILTPHENCTSPFTKPKYSRVLVGVTVSLCLLTLALYIQDSLSLSFLLNQMSAVGSSCLPASMQSSDYAVACWGEVVSVCLFLYDICQKHTLLLLNYTAEFVCSYKLL